MTNKEIASVLKETGQLIELTGGNTFRARAFENAARTLGRLEEPVTDRVAEGTLTDLSGIGDGLADDVAHLVRTGSFPGRDELLAELPDELPELLRVKGLGTKKVRAIWQELGVSSLPELEEAARSDRLTDLDGFGPKTRNRVIEQVELLRSYRGRALLPEAAAEAEALADRLGELEAVGRVAVAGSVRRAMETVGTLELVASSVTPKTVLREVRTWFESPSSVEEESAIPSRQGPGSGDSTETDGASRSGRGSRVQLRRSDGREVGISIVPPAAFGTALWVRTGASEHVDAFVDRFGWPGPHEEDASIYASAGLAYVPPERREGREELDRAAAGESEALIEPSDLRGSMHAHTTYSDGAQSVEEMARAARARGRTYLVLSDHSQSLRVAGGLTPEEVVRQREEIREVNRILAGEEGGFRVLHGIESDILADGALDYDEEVLQTFDLVIASVHSRFEMSEEEATERIVRAVRDPHTHLLGHPTGRLLLRREGYPIDHARVIEACAESSVAIELNANPRRFDLDWRWVGAAADAGVPVAITPDAHSVEEFDYEAWGVRVARKGGLTPEACLNAWSLEELEAWLDRRPS